MTPSNPAHDPRRAGLDPGRADGRFKNAPGRRCNNNCVFCYDDHAPRLSGRAAISAALRERRQRIDRINLQEFLSNEATIHPDFFSVLEEARGLGFARVGLISNGRMFSDAAFARRAAARLDDVRVSLHGATAATHEAQTRARGSFAQTLAGLVNLARLQGEGVWSGALFVSCVMTARNLPELPALVRLARRLSRVAELNFVQLIPSPTFGADFARVAARLRDASRAAEAALTEAEAADPPLRVTVELPFCALPARAERLFPPGTCEAVDFARPAHAPVCAGCVYCDRCGGVYERYAAVFGVEELTAQTEDRLSSARRASGENDNYI